MNKGDVNIKKYAQITIAVLVLVAITILSVRYVEFGNLKESVAKLDKNYVSYKSVDDVPEFDDKPYVILNDNKPFFNTDDYEPKSFVEYTPIDDLYRPQRALACIGVDIMPTVERSGNENAPYGSIVIKTEKIDGKTVYNSCHIIAYQLCGENKNLYNFMICTRYLNNSGMLPFENKIAKYVEETENHVLYRVTPIYNGDDFLPRGVQLEACSIEDNGKGVCFNVYLYNVQPGVNINYETGEVSKDD